MAALWVTSATAFGQKFSTGDRIYVYNIRGSASVYDSRSPTKVLGTQPLGSAGNVKAAGIKSFTSDTWMYFVDFDSGTDGWVFEYDVAKVNFGPPSIASSIANKIVQSGSSVDFYVLTQSAGPVAFQWYKDGSAIAGKTLDTLTIEKSQISDSGSYTLVVANAAGAVASNTALLSVVEVYGAQVYGGPGYVAGSTLIVSQAYIFGGTMSNKVISVLLPQGWFYLEDNAVNITSRPTVGARETLFWSLSEGATSPFSLSIRIGVPAGTSGVKGVLSLLSFSTPAGNAYSNALPNPLLISDYTFHDADTSKDGRIALTEVTRVIELYNVRNGTMRTGCYNVSSVSSEDGFSSDSLRESSATVALSRYHLCDVNRDGKISLTELTRVIELYNYRSGTTRTGQYKPQAGTEDGFTPGP